MINLPCRWIRRRVCALFSLAGILLFQAVPMAQEPWTLDRAIARAMSHNPDVRMAHHRMQASRAALDQAMSRFWPSLDVESSYLRTDNPLRAFGAVLNQEESLSSFNFNDVPDADNLNLRGIVTLPLYRGGQNQAGKEGARARLRASTHEAEAVRRALALEVTRAFNTLLKTREFIRAAEASVHAFSNHLAVARHRLDAGTLLRVDVLDLEVRHARAREDLVRARHANQIIRRIMENLLGLETEPFVAADHAPEVPVPSVDHPPPRPELEAAHARVRAARAALRRSRGGYRPHLDAFGSLDYDHGWVFDGSGESYTAGVMLRWNLWDGRRTRGRVDEALAGLEERREAERKVRLAINLEVEQAGLDLDQARERLEVTRTMVRQAEESVALTRGRFQEGLALSAQLIDAETALTSARMRRAEAEADWRIAVGALRKALGLPQLEGSQGRWNP